VGTATGALIRTVDFGHGGEGVPMISAKNPESARVGRANQKRTMPV